MGAARPSACPPSSASKATRSTPGATSPGRKTSWQELFARFDSHDIAPEEVDEFAQIMDEIVADRQNHPISFESPLGDEDGDER
jgi:hypothetical protein